MPTRDRAQFKLTRSAPYEKSKFLGSGGSMVARLKLKEIDGRAPPGKSFLSLNFERFYLLIVFYRSGACGLI